MRAGAKPRRAPAAKGGQWGERGARGLPGRHRSARPGVLTAAAARRDPAAVPGAAAKGAPWRGGWGATLLLSPLTGRLSEGAGGDGFVVLLLPVHFMAGFARGGRERDGNRRGVGLLPQEMPLRHRQRPTGREYLLR